MANRPALGVALGRLHPSRHLEVAVEADRLGFESVWLPEHLVFPVEMGGSPFPGAEHPPVPPETPVFDCFAYLSFLAGRTERVRLGSHVFLLGLRHPFIAARAIQTLDLVSGDGSHSVKPAVAWDQELPSGPTQSAAVRTHCRVDHAEGDPRLGHRPGESRPRIQLGEHQGVGPRTVHRFAAIGHRLEGRVPSVIRGQLADDTLGGG